MDFGIAIFAETTSLYMSAHISLRWTTPELLDPVVRLPRKTPASDVYAFGCLLIEVGFCNPLLQYRAKAAVALWKMSTIPGSGRASSNCRNFKGRIASRIKQICGWHGDACWRVGARSTLLQQVA
jgi:hypothetical protein